PRPVRRGSGRAASGWRERRGGGGVLLIRSPVRRRLRSGTNMARSGAARGSGTPRGNAHHPAARAARPPRRGRAGGTVMAGWARWGRRSGGVPPRGRRAPAAAVVAVAAAALAAGPAWAQQEDTRRRERALRQAEPELRGTPGRELSLGERAFVDAGGFFTFTFLNLNDESSNSRRLLQYDTTL